MTINPKTVKEEADALEAFEEVVKLLDSLPQETRERIIKAAAVFYRVELRES